VVVVTADDEAGTLDVRTVVADIAGVDVAGVVAVDVASGALTWDTGEPVD
jgi:hypothetical protein